MPTLTELSRESRKRHYRGRSLGTRDHESKRTGAKMALIGAAVSAAAGERIRHGRMVTDQDREDARSVVMLDLLAANGGDNLPPLADLTADSDRPSLPTGDGSRLHWRPSRGLIRAAGSALDALRHDRETPMMAGGIYGASRETRQAAETRRAAESQLVDPTADPMPPHVAAALDSAGVWPNDPLRVAVAESVTSLPITSDDWVVTTYAAGKTASYVRTMRERGREQLAVTVDEDGNMHADPSRPSSPVAQAFGAALRQAVEPTEAESRERAAGAVGRFLKASAAEEEETHASPLATRERTEPVAPAPCRTRLAHRGAAVVAYLDRWL